MVLMRPVQDKSFTVTHPEDHYHDECKSCNAYRFKYTTELMKSHCLTPGMLILLVVTTLEPL